MLWEHKKNVDNTMAIKVHMIARRHKWTEARATRISHVRFTIVRIMEDHPDWPNVLATEDPDPGEVNKFYEMMKTHPKFSEVARDDLLEIIQKELRARNREVIESQDLHKKYLNFIEHNYVPLHPELHHLENWEFEVDTLEAISLGLFEESVKV